MSVLGSSHKYPFASSLREWGEQFPSKRMVLRFHYHSQNVIGCVGFLDVPGYVSKL